MAAEADRASDATRIMRMDDEDVSAQVRKVLEREGAVEVAQAVPPEDPEEARWAFEQAMRGIYRELEGDIKLSIRHDDDHYAVVFETR